MTQAAEPIILPINQFSMLQNPAGAARFSACMHAASLVKSTRIQGVGAAKGRALSNNWANVNYTRPRDLRHAIGGNFCFLPIAFLRLGLIIAGSTSSTGEEAIPVAVGDQLF